MDPRIAVAPRVVTKKGNVPVSSKNPQGATYLAGLEKEKQDKRKGEHKKNYLASLEKEKAQQQAKINPTPGQSRFVKQAAVVTESQTVQPNQPRKQRKNALTQTGERILGRREVSQQGDTEARKKQMLIERMLQNQNSQVQAAQAQIGEETEVSLSGRLAQSTKSTVVTTYKRIRAGQASVAIFWTAISFWPVQAVFWGAELIGLGSKTIPIAHWFIPSETIFFIMNFLVMTIGLITILCSVVYYTLRLVDAFSGWKGIIFCFCVALYCLPIINFFPWFIPWIVATTYFQGED